MVFAASVVDRSDSTSSSTSSRDGLPLRHGVTPKDLERHLSCSGTLADQRLRTPSKSRMQLIHPESRWRAWRKLQSLHPLVLMDMALPILMPTGGVRQAWDLVMLCVLLYVAVIVPVELSFPETLFVRGLVTVDWVMTALLSADIVIHFRTAYITPRGDMVRDSRAIARRYLQGMFVFDVAAAVPLHIIFWGHGETHQYIFWLALLKLAPLMRLMRLIRGSGHLGNAVAMVRLLLFMMLLAHWTACFWHYLSEAIPQWPWMFNQQCAGCSPGVHYLLGFYSSFLLLLGDRPDTNNNLERAVVTCLLFLGTFIYAVVMGSIVLLVANIWATASRHKQRAAMVTDALRYRGVSPEVRDQVCNYYEYLEQFSHPGSDGIAFLQELPVGLYGTVTASMFGPRLAQVQLFAYCERPFLFRLAQRLRLSLFMTGDVVYEIGAVGHDMYVVWKGAVGLVAPDGCMAALMVDGDHFGELGLMSASTPRPHRAVVLKPSDIMMLSRWDLQEAMKDFPDSAALVKERARQKLEDHEAPGNVWIFRGWGAIGLGVESGDLGDAGGGGDGDGGGLFSHAFGGVAGANAVQRRRERQIMEQSQRLLEQLQQAQRAQQPEEGFGQVAEAESAAARRDESRVKLRLPQELNAGPVGEAREIPPAGGSSRGLGFSRSTDDPSSHGDSNAALGTRLSDSTAPDGISTGPSLELNPAERRSVDARPSPLSPVDSQRPGSTESAASAHGRSIKSLTLRMASMLRRDGRQNPPEDNSVSGREGSVAALAALSRSRDGSVAALGALKRSQEGSVVDRSRGSSWSLGRLGRLRTSIDVGGSDADPDDELANIRALTLGLSMRAPSTTARRLQRCTTLTAEQRRAQQQQQQLTSGGGDEDVLLPGPELPPGPEGVDPWEPLLLAPSGAASGATSSPDGPHSRPGAKAAAPGAGAGAEARPAHVDRPLRHQRSVKQGQGLWLDSLMLEELGGEEDTSVGGSRNVSPQRAPDIISPFAAVQGPASGASSAAGAASSRGGRNRRTATGQRSLHIQRSVASGAVGFVTSPNHRRSIEQRLMSAVPNPHGVHGAERARSALGGAHPAASSRLPGLQQASQGTAVAALPTMDDIWRQIEATMPREPQLPLPGAGSHAGLIPLPPVPPLGQAERRVSGYGATPATHVLRGGGTRSTLQRTTNAAGSGSTLASDLLMGGGLGPQGASAVAAAGFHPTGSGGVAPAHAPSRALMARPPLGTRPHTNQGADAGAPDPIEAALLLAPRGSGFLSEFPDGSVFALPQQVGSPGTVWMRSPKPSTSGFAPVGAPRSSRNGYRPMAQGSPVGSPVVVGSRGLGTYASTHSRSLHNATSSRTRRSSTGYSIWSGAASGGMRWRSLEDGTGPYDEDEEDDDWSSDSSSGAKKRMLLGLRQQLAEANARVHMLEAQLLEYSIDPMKVPAVVALLQREVAGALNRMGMTVDRKLTGVRDSLVKLSGRAEDLSQQVTSAEDRLKRLELSTGGVAGGFGGEELAGGGVAISASSGLLDALPMEILAARLSQEPRSSNPNLVLSGGAAALVSRSLSRLHSNGGASGGGAKEGGGKDWRRSSTLGLGSGILGGMLSGTTAPVVPSNGGAKRAGAASRPAPTASQVALHSILKASASNTGGNSTSRVADSTGGAVFRNLSFGTERVGSTPQLTLPQLLGQAAAEEDAASRPPEREGSLRRAPRSSRIGTEQAQSATAGAAEGAADPGTAHHRAPAIDHRRTQQHPSWLAVDNQ